MERRKEWTEGEKRNEGKEREGREVEGAGGGGERYIMKHCIKMKPKNLTSYELVHQHCVFHYVLGC